MEEEYESNAEGNESPGGKKKLVLGYKLKKKENPCNLFFQISDQAKFG